ncbi:peptidoglycan DD-metalloendopeptidase family protein [Calidifontibacter sp. DB0510]|uniref:Peptidoglycan DD-metalloendopeptidase family protein n=1 Tax=Metallococcus carri TaxID=1656884 RepID=A0A967B2W2_9MICO|nr:peptidoglycan DD-metalloendopeptidase family protein [Metallococcus carri]NHN56275.1 peptidoglycan DD-metalloendopeptidase family protein [Metallococcus carri]NOP38673.1 peptidoglycan DD-metalloendopeptidase family protein [Calidifontibacter sp. DB2511S]
MNKLIRSVTLLGAAAAIGVPVVTLPGGSASAASARNGSCETGEFCYYFNSNNQGSVSDFARSVGDYGTTQPGCYDFKSRGNGKGRCVKNNAASVWNRSTKTVRVYFNSNFGGTFQDIKPGAKVNLNASLKNQNASHEFVTPGSTARVNMSRALYKRAGGSITCYFDGYRNTPGRHEGIDIARSIGSPVYALVGGTVTYVAQGAKGSSGLSTIAIYNAKLGRTVIYLHSDPVALKKGQKISRGQLIGHESWRGLSSSGIAHTHVEMRPGWHDRAAKSVRDYTLSNPNPNTFWRSQGYNVK